MTPYLVLAALTLAAWVTIGLLAVDSAIRTPRLDRVGRPRADEPPLPRVSVVVAARNEERSVEPALRSLLALSYPDYEVVFVDDRSTDRTGEIAERLAAEYALLSVIHVNELPPGWFGKNHAAQQGADVATGELLLFTDGDITFAPNALSRGVRHLLTEHLDHLSASPRSAVNGIALQGCMVTFHLLSNAALSLLKVRDPDSSSFFGLGAYALIRADAYRAIGGHAQIALRPDEDIRIAQLVKMSGRRSAFLNGEALIECPWYHSAREFTRGGDKNFFAILDYRVWKVAAVSFALTWFAVAPFVLAPLLLSAGEIWSGTLFAACPLVYWPLVLTVFRDESYSRWSVLPVPLVILVLVYMMWRSMVLTMTRGVVWGGPAVPLSELKAAAVRVRDP